MRTLVVLLALSGVASAGDLELLKLDADNAFASLPDAVAKIPPPPPQAFYLRVPVQPVSAGMEDDKGWPVEKITYSDDRTLKYYAGKGGPFILVLPMTGDPDHKFSRGFCRRFAREGFRCGYVERRLPPEHDLPEGIDELFTLPGLPPKSAAAARQALDALEDLGRLKPGERVGVAGVSLGGVDAALVAATDDRIGAAAIMLGGADLGRMLAKVDGVAVKAYARKREAYMAKHGLTLEQFEAEMRVRTKVGDPLTYLAPGAEGARKEPLDPMRYLMISVSGDPAVPNECSRALYDGISRSDSSPEYVTVYLPFLPKKLKHVGGILALPSAKRRMVDHFRRFLKPIPS